MKLTRKKTSGLYIITRWFHLDLRRSLNLKKSAIAIELKLIMVQFIAPLLNGGTFERRNNLQQQLLTVPVSTTIIHIIGNLERENKSIHFIFTILF
jgi:hypothetical protein